jgi:hypothetical protein
VPQSRIAAMLERQLEAAEAGTRQA